MIGDLKKIYHDFLKGKLSRDIDEKGKGGVWDYCLDYAKGDIEKTEQYYHHVWKVFEYVKNDKKGSR